MPASSFIFLVIVALWAAYLVPSAIRRRRHAAEARVEDRDSAALRVVVRKGSAGPGAPVLSSRPVLNAAPERPQLAAAPGTAPAPDPAPAAPVAPVATPVLVRHAGTSRVVRRRRRLLGGVLAATVLTWALVLVSLLPLWVPLPLTAVLALVVVALRRHAAQAPVRVVAPTSVDLADFDLVPPPAAAPSAAGVLDELSAQLERDPAAEPGAVPAPRAAHAAAPRGRVVRPARASVPAPETTRPAGPSVRARRVVDVREPARVVNG